MKFYDYIFAGLVFFIPLSTAIPNIILLLITIFFLFKLNKKDINIFKNRFNQLFVCIIILILLNSLNNGSVIEDISLLFRLVLIFLIQIMAFKVTNINLVKMSFILSVNIVVLMSIFSILNFYLETGSFVFGNTSSVSKVLPLERPYLGFLCTLNVLVSFQVINYYFKTSLKIVFLLSVIISILLIVTISARLSLISLVVVLFLRIFYSKKKDSKKKIQVFTIFMLSILSLIITVFLNKNLSERFFIEDTYEKSLKKMAIYEPRIVIWNCAKNIISSESYSTIIGLQGFNKTSNKLVDCYDYDIQNKSKKKYFLNEKFNTHNQFIDFFLSHGIFLVTLLLLLFIDSIRININRFYNIAIIFVFFLFFLVENIFHRQLGCYIFGLFVYLYFYNHNFFMNKTILNYNITKLNE